MCIYRHGTPGPTAPGMASRVGHGGRVAVRETSRRTSCLASSGTPLSGASFPSRPGNNRGDCTVTAGFGRALRLVSQWLDRHLRRRAGVLR
jgi:hypothetical protein